MRKIIRFLDKVSAALLIPLLIWVVVAHILKLFGKFSPMTGWFAYVGMSLTACLLVVLPLWMFLRAVAYEDKS